VIDDKREQQELIQELAEIVNRLGWVIALPTNVDMVPGLIIGQEDFVKEVVETYYGPNYDVFKEDPTGENALVELQTKKKDTVH
jgi:hypothetical protein